MSLLMSLAWLLDQLIALPLRREECRKRRGTRKMREKEREEESKGGEEKRRGGGGGGRGGEIPRVCWGKMVALASRRGLLEVVHMVFWLGFVGRFDYQLLPAGHQYALLLPFGMLHCGAPVLQRIKGSWGGRLGGAATATVPPLPYGLVFNSLQNINISAEIWIGAFCVRWCWMRWRWRLSTYGPVASLAVYDRQIRDWGFHAQRSASVAAILLSIARRRSLQGNKLSGEIPSVVGLMQALAVLSS